MALWYFAYGSNLLKEQMLARTGRIGDPDFPPRIADLPNWQVVFQCLDEASPAFANIQTPGRGVTGVIYRCSPIDLEKLDVYEAGYERQFVEVTDGQGDTVTAVAYIMRPTSPDKYDRPADDYLNRILNGAKQHNLCSSYITSIVTIARAKNC